MHCEHGGHIAGGMSEALAYLGLRDRPDSRKRHGEQLQDAVNAMQASCRVVPMLAVLTLELLQKALSRVRQRRAKTAASPCDRSFPRARSNLITSPHHSTIAPCRVAQALFQDDGQTPAYAAQPLCAAPAAALDGTCRPLARYQANTEYWRHRPVYAGAEGV